MIGGPAGWNSGTNGVMPQQTGVMPQATGVMPQMTGLQGGVSDLLDIFATLLTLPLVWILK